MKIYAQALDLKDNKDLIMKYENYHKNVWPETLEGLKYVGVLRMRIWRVNNRLFMLMETSDDFYIEKFQDYTSNNPKAKEWNDLMINFQQQIPSPTGEWWSPMSLAFDSEWFD
jgi:L-rhamnose mutarotase